MNNIYSIITLVILIIAIIVTGALSITNWETNVNLLKAGSMLDINANIQKLHLYVILLLSIVTVFFVYYLFKDMWKPSIIGSWSNPTSNVAFIIDSDMDIEWIDFDGSGRDGRLVKDLKKENMYKLGELKYFYDVSTDTVTFNDKNTIISCFRNIL